MLKMILKKVAVPWVEAVKKGLVRWFSTIQKYDNGGPIPFCTGPNPELSIAWSLSRPTFVHITEAGINIVK